MSREIANPLAALIAQAARTLPAQTGAAAAAAERLCRSTVILADVSGSMDERADTGRRIDRLREALTEVWTEHCRLIAFSTLPRPLTGPEYLPEPEGATNMGLALDATHVHRPRAVVLISDGHPTDEAAAIAAARGLSCPIHTIYCGPEHDTGAIAFLRRLAAAAGGGAYVHRWGGPTRLAAVLRPLLLTGPA
jgi:hypothetical protein